MRISAVRLSAIAAVGIMMGLSLNAGAASRELMTNGDFEKLDENGQPLTPFGKLVDGNSFELDGANHVLKLTPKNKQVFQWTPPAGAIKSGKEYSFSFNIKGNKVQGFRLCLWTQLPNKHEPPNGPIFSENCSGTFDWKKDEVKFKMPDGITRITLFLDFGGIHPAGEAVWLDEISIRPVGAPAEFAKISGGANIPRECIPNGNFEDIDEDGKVLTPWGKVGDGNSFELEGINTFLKVTPKSKLALSWKAKPGIIEYGKEYRFSFRIKGDDLKNFRFCLWTQLPDKHEPPNGPIFSEWQKGTFDWKKEEVKFKMPDGITRFTIFFDGMQNGGTVYVDDLSIMPVDAVAAAEQAAKDPLPSYRGFQTKHEIFMFPHGSKGGFEFKLINRRESPSEVKAIFSFGRHGQDAGKSEERVIKIGPASAVMVPYELEAAKFPFGVYDISARFVDVGSNKEIGNTSISVGICSSTSLRKAKDGEFLYGLDASLQAAFRDKKRMLWTEYMGVDIIRGGFETWEDRDKNSGDLMNMLKEGMPVYKNYNLSVMLNVDPPVPKSDDWMLPYDQLLAKRIAFVENAARTYPEVKYWELGNEPDIDFYKGPKEQYAADFVKLYQAIKRGNKNTVVMNGGFAYDRNNILTILKNIPDDSIDIIAYHGHGPGANAERSAYTINRQLADATGHADKLLTETESGMDARTYEQEEAQAATVIQKIAYAQSRKEPLFMFFRLAFEHPAEYNMTRFEDRRQPRPCILSYRALVETLRGCAFSHAIDFGREGAESYAFSEPGTGRRAAVFWVNSKISYGIFLKAGTAAGKISNAKIVDMYGNSKDGSVLSDGRIRLEIDNFPKFVTWTSAEPDFKAMRGHSDLELEPAIEIPVGGSAETTMILHNSGTTSIQPEIRWEMESNQPVAVSMKQDAAALGAGEERKQTATLSLDKWTEDNDWPKEWHVFTFVKPEVDLSTFTSVPETLPGEKGIVNGTSAFFINNKIDLAKIGGGYREKAVAVLFAEYDSDSDKKVKVGGAADYWMDWYVNGKRVYDTLNAGNGAGYYVHSHRIEIPLRKGKNLIAIKVLSGSQGWCIVAGGPKDLQKALGGKSDKVKFSLFSRKDKIAEESMALKFIHPVAALAGGFQAMNDKLMSREEPTGILGADSIQNLFFKEPDTNKWWKGERDLSATVWLRQDSGNLLVAVEVEDDTHVPAKGADDLFKSDSLEIAVSGGTLAKPLYFAIGEVDGKAIAVSLDGGASPKAKMSRSGSHTCYYIEIPWTKLVGAKEGFVNARINDNDAGYLKQHAVWKPDYENPAAPSKWYRVMMP